MSRSLQVLLLWDLSGSTRTRQELGEPTYRRLVDTIGDIVSSAAALHDGVTFGEDAQGDGGWARFPSAHGALSAAVDLQRRAQRVTEFGDRPRLRVALAASDLEHDAVTDRHLGPAFAVASRIESLAGSELDLDETILCQDVVKRLADGWDRTEMRFVDDFELRGVNDPVGVYAVDWSRSPIAEALGLPEPLATATDASFVGRTEQLEALERWWEWSSIGRAGAVLVEADAGFGKTRLCAEFAARVRAEGGAVLYGRCDQRGSSPFQPFVTALRSFLPVSTDVAKDVGPSARELVRLVPELADRLPMTDAVPSPSPDQQSIQSAIAAWLGRLASDAPTLMVLDDLAWATDETIESVDAIIRSLQNSPLLLVLTQRPRESGPDHRARIAALTTDAAPAEGRPASITLEPLDPDEVRRLALDLTAAPVEDPELLDTLLTVSGGRPLYVQELLRGSRDGRLLDLRGRLPGSFESSIASRLADMSTTTRRVLRTACVAGVTVVREVLYAAHRDLPRDTVTTALVEAERGGIIRVSGPETVEFAHALLHEIVTQELGPTGAELPEEHRQVADAIESVHGRYVDEHLEQLAGHYEQAGDSRAAAELYRRAADRAKSSLAHTEAVRLLGRAIEVHRSGDPAVQAELHIELGQAEKRAGLGGARDTLSSAYNHAQAVSDPELSWALSRTALLADYRGIFNFVGQIDMQRVRRLRACIADAPSEELDSRARLIGQLAVELTVGQDREQREDLVSEALELAEACGNPVTLARARAQYMHTMWHPDGLAERIRVGRELRRHPEGLERQGIQLEAITAYLQACREHGDFQEANRLLDELTELAAELKQPTTIGFARLRQSAAASMAGRLEEGARFADEFLAASLEANQPDAIPFAAGLQFHVALHDGSLADRVDELRQVADALPEMFVFRAAHAFALAEIGRVDDAREPLSRVMRSLDDIRFDLNWLLTLSFATAAAARIGDHDSLTVLRELISPYADQYVDIGTVFLGRAAHYVALADLALGDRERGTTALRELVEDYYRIDAVPMAVRASIDFARAFDGTSPSIEARQLLDRADDAARDRNLEGLRSTIATELDRVWALQQATR